MFLTQTNKSVVSSLFCTVSIQQIVVLIKTSSLEIVKAEICSMFIEVFIYLKLSRKKKSQREKKTIKEKMT